MTEKLQAGDYVVIDPGNAEAGTYGIRPIHQIRGAFGKVDSVDEPSAYVRDINDKWAWFIPLEWCTKIDEATMQSMRDLRHTIVKQWLHQAAASHKELDDIHVRAQAGDYDDCF